MQSQKQRRAFQRPYSPSKLFLRLYLKILFLVIGWLSLSVGANHGNNSLCTQENWWTSGITKASNSDAIPRFELTVGQSQQQFNINTFVSDRGNCHDPIKIIFYDGFMQKLTDETYKRANIQAIDITSTNQGHAQSFNLKVNQLPNQYWGANSNGYEDINFFYEIWPDSSTDNIGKQYSHIQGFTVRIKNKCFGKTLTSVTLSQSSQTLYVGSSKTVSNFVTVNTSSGGADTDCFYVSKIYVQNVNQNWVGPDDHYFSQVLSSYTLATSHSAQSTSMTITPSIAQFEHITANQNVLIKVLYYWSNQGGSYVSSSQEGQFTVTIKDFQSLWNYCNQYLTSFVSLNTSNKVGNRSYTVGGSDLTITPHANQFTVNSCADTNLPGVTGIPQLVLKKNLQYKENNTWVNFPMNEAGGTFFSINYDTTCVKEINIVTLQIKIGCTAIDKFAKDGEKSFDLRYTIEYEQKNGQTLQANIVSDEFSITFINPCKLHTITLGTPTQSIETYSGGTLTNTAIQVTHSPTTNTACSPYTTYLVEASIQANNLGYTSTGTAYTDLISTSNTDLAFTLSPKTSVYDGGTAPRTAYVKVTIKSTYAQQLAQTYVYTITVQPKSKIVELADSQLSTRTKFGKVPNIIYTVGDPAILVQMPPFTVTATDSTAPTKVPVMETQIKLYHNLVEITSTANSLFLSETLDTSCMINFDATIKSFQVYCSDNSKFWYTGGSKDFTLQYQLQYKQVEGSPANPQTNSLKDEFTLTIRNKCWGDVLTKISSTSEKKTYAGATMNIPAIQFAHKTGITDQDCPVDFIVQVQDNSTYVSSGSAYTDLIHSATSGSLVLKPTTATFGTGNDASKTNRNIRVTYKNQKTGTQIQDDFLVEIYSTAAYAKLANDQLDTIAYTPHPDVTYTLGQAALVVPKINALFKHPVDITGFNDFSSMNLPAVTFSLEKWNGSTWVELTSANYQAQGVIGLDSSNCMSALESDFAFTLYCNYYEKFGQDTSGKDVYLLRYTAKYRDVTTNQRIIYDPFTVTIINPCSEAKLSITDSNRTLSQSAYVSATTFKVVPSIQTHITGSTISGTACAFSFLVEIYDDQVLKNWTSNITNALYEALLGDGTTTHPNTQPALKIKASSTYFDKKKTVQLRVTYTLVASQKTDGTNRIVDQFTVTIYPSAYVEACSTASLSHSATIDSFDLVVKHAVGTAANDKAFTAALSNSPASCTPTYSYVLWYISPLSGATTANPWSAYFTQTSGTLSYTAPPAEKLNGNAYLVLNFKIVATLNEYPSLQIENSFAINLKNPCKSYSFASPSTQAAIDYEDGSNVDVPVAAFTYSDDGTINNDCNVTHEILFKDALTDVWSTTRPSYVFGTPDSINLSFNIKTTSVAIATPGDLTASRWVRRRHFNPYTNEETVQEFQIFFYKSLFCRAKTAALVGPSTLDLADAVVGTSKTILSQINTQSSVLTTSANTSSSCNYSATCYIFDSSTQTWVLLSAHTTSAEISCSATGQWTINVPATNNAYNPSTTLLMRVVYEITDSQVPLWQTPSRQVKSEFQLTIKNSCSSAIVTHSAFADVIYIVGSGSVQTTFSPQFSGYSSPSCPYAISLSLKKDGQGDQWVSSSDGSPTFTIGTTTYTFIKSLTTDSTNAGLGTFTIELTDQALIRPDLKFNAQIVLSNSKNGLKDTLKFDILLVDVCSKNELSQASTQANITHTVLPASTATADLTVYWTTITQNNVATYTGTSGAPAGASCPITREVYIQQSNQTWLKATDRSAAGSPTSYNGQTPSLDWFKSYENQAASNALLGSSAAFVVSATHDSAYLSGLFVNFIGRTYNVKMVSFDPNSKTTKHRIEEIFTVTFAYSCNADALCITSDGTSCLTTAQNQSQSDASANINYTAGDAQVTIPKSVKQTVTGCAYTTLYEYFDTANQSWTDFSTIQNTAITAHSSADGQVQVHVSSADANNFCPQKSYLIRVTYTSTQSTTASRSVFDQYTITIKAYPNSEITLKSSVRETYTYSVPSSSAPLVMNPITSATNTITQAGCPVTCVLQRLDSSHNWISLASTPELTFITTGNGVCGLTVDFTLTDSFWTTTLAATRTTYQLRIGVQYTAVFDATNQYAVYDDFELVMQHFCYNDFYQLSTKKPDITQTIYPVAQTSGNQFGKTAVSATQVVQSIAACSQFTAYSLEIWNNAGKLWIDYGSQSAADKNANQPYIANYDAATAQFDILFTSDLGTSWHGKTIDMRIKTTNPKSGQVAGTIYDDFKVTFVYACVNDELSITNVSSDISKQSYTYGATSLTIPTPTITQTETSCAKTFKIYAFSQLNNVWRDKEEASNPLPFISAFDTATGVASVQYAGAGNSLLLTGTAWKPETILQMKIVATSTHSKTAKATVTDEWQLNMSDKCSANRIALDASLANSNSGTAVSDFTYTIGTATVTKKPLISTIQTNTDCPITSKLYVYSEISNSWIEQTTPSAPYNSWISSFTTSSGTLEVSQAAGAYQASATFKVKITFVDVLALNPHAITIESTFDVTIVHTCATNPFTISDQTDLVYTVPADSIDSSSPTTLIAKTVVNNQNTSTFCWLSYRTDMWDESSDTWITLTAALTNASPRNTFIKSNTYLDTKTDTLSFDSNSYELFLPFSSLQSFENNYGSSPIKMRSQVTDVTGRVLYDEYNLTFKFACWADDLSISLANDITDQIYEFGASSQALTAPQVTQSQSGCEITYKVFGLFNSVGSNQIWKDSSACSNCLSYIIQSFVTTTGVITVYNAAGTKITAGDLKPQSTLQLRIQATSTYSRTAQKVVADDFNLKMRISPCVDNKLAFDSTGSSVYPNPYGTAVVSDVSYEIGASTVTIQPKYSTLMDTTACPLTAYLWVLDEQTNQWLQDSTSVFNNAWIASFNIASGAQIAGQMTIYQSDSGTFIAEKSYQVKIQIKDLKTLDPVASAVETIFSVQVYHKCSRNTFSIDDQTDKIYEISATGTATAVNVAKSTVTGATPGCTLQYTIEIYDLPNNSWVTVSQANRTLKYSFIKASVDLDDLSTNVFDIETTSFTSWANTSQIMRLRVKDPNSSQVNGNRVDDFKIFITYICNLDEISVTSQISDQIYVFSATASTLTTPNFAQSKTGCATTWQLQIYSVSLDEWISYSSSDHGYFISGWDASNGVVQITNDGSGAAGQGSLKPMTAYQIRISKTSTHSKTAKQTAHDEFTLTLQEGCYNNQLRMDGSLAHSSGGSIINDFDYKVTVAASATTVTLNPLYSSSLSMTSCPLTATLFIWDDLTNQWIDHSNSQSVNFVLGFIRTANGSDKAGKLTIYKSSQAWIAEKIYTVKLSITDLQSSDPVKNAIEHTFQVDVYHACQRNTIQYNQDQQNQQFVIKAVTSSSVPVEIANSAVTTLEIESTCTLIRSLEIFDPISHTWVRYLAAQSATFPWIFDWTDPVGAGVVPTSSTNGFKVQTADFATYDNETILPSVFQLRMKVQDYYSTTSTAIVYDNYSITIKYECDDDVVTLTADERMYVYSTRNGVAETISAKFAQSIATCEMIYKAEVLDLTLTGSTALNQPSIDMTNSWTDITLAGTGDLAWRTGFNAGALTIQTSTSYDPYKDYTIRITYTSKYSQKSEAERTKVEEFTLRLTPSSACIWNILTKTGEIAPWEYIVSNTSGPISKTPQINRSVSNCKYNQKLYFFNDQSNLWVQYSTATSTNYPFVSSFTDGENTADTDIGKLTIQADRSMATQYWKPFKIYKVKITLDDLDSNHLQLKSWEFTLELRDICADNTIIKNGELQSTSTIRISAQSQTLTPDFTMLTTTAQHGCISVATLNFFDTERNIYVTDNTGSTITGEPYAFVNSFSTTNGVLVVQTSDVAKYSIQKDFNVMISINLPESLKASNNVVYYFKIIVKHLCADNNLTLQSDLGYQIYYIDHPNTDGLSTTLNKIITPDVQKDIEVSTCPLTCTIEQWNKSKQIWESDSLVGTTLLWSWKKTFAATNTATLDVWTSDISTYHPQTGYPNNSKWTDIDLRLTLRDPYSQTKQNFVQDIFTLSLRRPCSDSVLNQTNNLPAFKYYIGSGNSANIVPLYTMTGVDGNGVACAPFFYLHFWDEYQMIWVEYLAATHSFVGSWTAASGTLVINTSDFVTYDVPSVITTRITTMNSAHVFEDQFKLTLIDQCREATLSTGITIRAIDDGSTRSEANPFTWHMWQYAQANFNQIVISATPHACPITYMLTDVNMERTQIKTDTMRIDESNADYQIQALFRNTQTRFYYVRATVKNVRDDFTVLTTEAKFYVSITNPCILANQITAKTITGFPNYWIKDAEVTETITPFADWTTTTYGNQVRTHAPFSTGDNLCGSKVYRLYKTYPDRVAAVLHDPVTQPWISLKPNNPNYTLSVQTDDPKYYTNADFNFYLRVSLADYEILNPDNCVRWQAIPLNLKSCRIGDFQFTEIPDVTYHVYIPVIHINLQRFTESGSVFAKAGGSACGYTVTYITRWRNFYDTVIPLPPWIKWNAAEFRYEVYTKDPKDINNSRQIYKLELVGSIGSADMNPVLTKTQTVNLIVDNECEHDEMTITQSITDYTYYINENTEKGSWAQGILPKPKDMKWYPKWTQKVEGCPVMQKLYRTPDTVNGVVGVRTAHDISPTTPIYEYSFTQIPVDVLWSVTKPIRYPFEVIMGLKTADFENYDRQSWKMHVVLESTHSLHAKREGQINFQLDIMDVCWQLPLTTFNIRSSIQEYDIWKSHQIVHELMLDQWGDYCTGSSYILEYVSGPKLLPGGDPLLIDINQYYADRNKYKTQPWTGNADPYLEGIIPDITWEGTHTVRLIAQQGTTKKYNKINGPNFTITYINPCRRAIVTPGVLTNMIATIGQSNVVTQVYTDYPDDVSTLYGNGFNKCGLKSHYLTTGSGDAQKTLPDQIYRIIEYLNFKTNSASQIPKTYRFEVQSSNYASIGTHSLVLNVALDDYPTATVARVPFQVLINPCVVTYFEPPSDYVWDYVIGYRFSNYQFNFVQGPCAYKQTFSAKLKNGAAVPKFVTSSSTEGYVRVFATNQTDAGEYEIIVTSQLENLEIFGNPSSTIDASLKIDKNNPPSSFIYKSSFKIYLNVRAAPPPYLMPNNTAPFFIPTPVDLWFYASDYFVKGFGPTYDNEANKVTVTTDFGNAARFIFWDSLTNTLTVPANATNVDDLGEYPIKLILNDGVTQANDNSSWVGNVTYNFKLSIFRKPLQVAQVQKPPDVRLEEVFVKYKSSVIDVRTFDKSNFLNAVENSVVKTAQPQLADPTLKVIDVKQESTQTGQTNFNASTLPRVTMTEKGTITTTLNTESKFVVTKQNNNIQIAPPKPFVKSMNESGVLKIGFTSKMRVPANLQALNNQKVALRWMQSSNYQNETYLTPEGYRDFEIRPAVDLQLDTSLDSKQDDQSYTYEIVGFTEDEMIIKVKFSNPEAISSAGITSDKIKVTFWSSDLLQGDNGLSLEEGQTISKSLVPQIEPYIAEDLTNLGRNIGMLVSILIGIGLFLTYLTGFDQTPFWLFFNVWQLFMHVPLLNLKIPGFVALFWRQQLKIFTMRNDQVNNWLNQLSHVPIEQRQSYTILLDAAGFSSTHIYVNLGLILWIPLGIVALMPFAWAIDNFCSIADKRMEKFGGRKPLTTKPLLQMLTNLLTRYAIISILDVLICVFISLSSAYSGQFQAPHYSINISISWALLSLLCLLVLFQLVYGIHRFKKAKHAAVWKDYEISGYVSTLFEGTNIQHPERSAFFMTIFLLRQAAYSATIVFLYETPVFQLYVLLATSIAYNAGVAYCKPFTRVYNSLLHFINEFAFFFVITCCLSFTDFVMDILTRIKTASMLSSLMFVVLSLNVLISLIGIILSQNFCCQKNASEEPKEEDNEKILNQKRTFRVADVSDRNPLQEQPSDRNSDQPVELILQRGQNRIIIEEDDSELRTIPAVLRLDTRKFQQNDLEALIQETMMPVVQEDWHEDKRSSSNQNQVEQFQNNILNAWDEKGEEEMKLPQLDQILSQKSSRSSKQSKPNLNKQIQKILDTEDEIEVNKLIQEHKGSQLSFSVAGESQDLIPDSKIQNSITKKEIVHHFNDSLTVLNAPIQNEWVGTNLDRSIIGEETKVESSGEDAILTTKHTRKQRNKAKDIEPQPRRNTMDNNRHKAYALDEILDQATQKNAHVRRKSRKERQQSKSPSPEPPLPKNDSPSRWKVLRRKQYEEPDLL